MNISEAKEIINSTFSSDFDEQRYKKFVSNLFKKYEPQNKVVEGQYIKLAYKAFVIKYKIKGTFEDVEGHKIDILEVNLNKASTLERARTAQRNFVAEYLKSRNKDAALVAFVSPDNKEWRLSLVKLENSLEVVDEKLKTKEEITPAKRWSFLVGKNEGSHTAQSRFVDLLVSDKDPNLKELEQAFNIETVTNEFFKKYKELFFKLKEHLDNLLEKDEIIKKDFEEKEISIVDFAKKTLGQIVFLYFLQKKGWFGVAPDKEWGEGPKKFLRELFERREKYGNNFFNDILEPLFYKALAQDRGKESLYPDLNNCRMPFLNGGLFEPMNGYMWEITDIVIPDKLFSNDYKDPKTGDIGSGIFDVFDRYNFTVNENEPLEKEVAVDPEMLGKVFENLLDIKDRKSKGAFYTPREIVHYMCQESLINYLDTETNNEIPREDLELFIQKGDRIIENDAITLERKEGREKKYGTDKYQDSTYSLLLPKSVRVQADKLDELLKNIKVADPAVGSGAFPLGMINEIVRARKVLNVYIKQDISDYELKKHTITHSIYGVDIDPGAVDIAKLRLWLALVVDEETPHPLPNLEHKIMQGNSLISEYEGIKLFDESIFESEKNNGVKQLALGLGKTISELKMEVLQDKIASFVNESQKTKKQNLKEEIDNLKWELIEETLKEQGKEGKLEEIKKLRKKNICPFFIWKLEFSDVFKDKGGFDVVIGNPPYIDSEEMVKKMPDLRDQYREIYSSASGNWDIFVIFIELAINLCHKSASHSFIVPNKLIGEKYSAGIRNLIKSQTSLVVLRDYSNVKVFSSADVYPCVYVLKKELNLKDPSFELMKDISKIKYSIEINRSVFLNDILWDKYFFPTNIVKLVNKISLNSPLSETGFKVENSATVGEAYDIKKLICKEKNNKNTFKLVNTGSIDRYVNKWKIQPVTYINDKYLMPYVDLEGFKENRIDQSKSPKLIIAGMTKELEVFFDEEGSYYAGKSTLLIKNNDTSALRFLIGILNSKLITFWYRITFNSLSMAGGYLKINNHCFSQIPIVNINDDDKKDIVKKVDQILTITSAPDYDPKNPPIKQKELEKKIDELVYKLYDLKDEEIKIIEDSSKK